MSGVGAKRSEAKANFVLRALPKAELDQVAKAGEVVEVGARTSVNEAGSRIEVVHFPITAVFSMVATVGGAPAVEVATIGREGMAGLPLFLGAISSPNATFCQVPGRSLRLSAEQFRDVLRTDGALYRQLHHFLQATMLQLSQNVVCNRLHSTQQRGSRWLLMTQDRVGAEKFPLTQEFLGQMIGVRRATVSYVATSLQRAGLIDYSRGVITVLDRDGLEAAACECYQVVRAEFDKLKTRRDPVA